MSNNREKLLLHQLSLLPCMLMHAKKTNKTHKNYQTDK